MAYLEPAPLSTVHEYGGDQYGAAAGSNIGVGVGFAELAVGLGEYCIGLLYRSEFEGHGSRDLLDILHGNNNSVPFDPGRTYALDYETETLRAAGVRLRRIFTVGEIGSYSLRLGVGASVLKPIDARWESMTGELAATTADYATGAAMWLRTGKEISSFNPFVAGGNPSGWGFSMDLHLRATSPSGTAFEIVAMDLYGRIHWRNMRNSVRMLDNSTIRYDANANREAFVHGLDTRINTVQNIPTKYRIAIAQPISAAWTAFAADDALHGRHFISIGTQYGTADSFVAATFDFRTHAVGLSARWGVLGVSLLSDQWSWRDASTLGMSIDIATRW